MKKQIEELTLLLLYLTSWEEKELGGSLIRSWKNHRFEALDSLAEKRLISLGKKAKSVYFNDKGVELAERLKTKYLGENRETDKIETKIVKNPIYQLKITLKEVKPTVWRRIQVPGDITLYRLCVILLEVMGWGGGHLHSLRIGNNYYNIPDPEFDSAHDTIDEREVILKDVICHEREEFVFDYDFGDNWEHKIVVEKIFPKKKSTKYPICLDGARACPPEDCGGSSGYERFLDAIRNSSHAEHESMLGWIGGEFDPEEFDLEGTNKSLKGILKRKPWYEEDMV